MGVSDRDYMHSHKRGPGLTFGLTPSQFITGLVACNVAIYLMPALFPGWGYVSSPTGGGHRLGAYSTSALLQGEVWTLLTYPFVHRDILHLSLNMLGLYFLGRPVLHSLGAGPFLAVYLGGGIAGALFETLFRAAALEPANILGASASVSALLALFVALAPQAKLRLYPFPVPIPARTLLWGFLLFNALAGLLTLKSSGPSTAYLAHCGGLFFGMFYARRFRPRPSAAFTPPRRKPEAPSVNYAARPKSPNIIDAEFSEPVDGDYNAVLDKINREGISSLTPRERRILEQASQKLNRQKQ